MKFLKDNLGLILAGSYAVLMSVVLFFDFQSLGNDFWSSASFNLTWTCGRNSNFLSTASLFLWACVIAGFAPCHLNR
jgi:hypothetical protein